MRNYKQIIIIITATCLLITTVGCNRNDVDLQFMDKNIAEIVNAIQTPKIPDREINLCEFSGHHADEAGNYNFYNDIRKAIDSLSSMGGGTLLFTHSQGQDAWIKQTEIFRVKGPIILKSNIELKFHPNTKLFFEFSPANYLPDGKPVLRRYEGTSLYTFCPQIYAFNASNIAITFAGGNGALPVIDGDGEKWQKWSAQGDLRVKEKGLIPAYSSIQTEMNEKDIPIKERICADTAYHFLRPAMMEFIHCNKIKIDGVKLIRSPFWVIHPVFSTDITVRNVMFDCQVVNNDGIDIESSSRVLVENVIFDNHDDNVAIKSGRNREGRDGAIVAGSEYEKIHSPFVKNGRITAPTTKVVIRNCVFKGHYAFCIGSEISGGANNIFVTDCWAPMDVVMGIFIKSSRKRGGVVEDIYIRNLNLNEVKSDAICIIPNYDNDSVSPWPSTFRNIYLDNIQVKEAKKGIRIFGWRDAPVENVMINNVRIDSVTSTYDDEIFLINQVKNIKMNKVNINNKSYDGEYNKTDPNAKPPGQG